MFQFLDPGPLVDGDLEIVLDHVVPPDESNGGVSSYHFRMQVHGQEEPVGGIRLRVGDAEYLALYVGHVGFDVRLEHRGNHYAARACRLLLPLARSHGLGWLWLTCDPENMASRRVCESLGAQFVGTVDVPADTELYRRGERRKRRYCLDL